MTRFTALAGILLSMTLMNATATLPAPQRPEELPTEWIDGATGHRVIRLSREAGSESLYFHQNAYTPDGQKLIITTPTGLSTIDLKTRAIEQVVEGRVNVIVTGRKSGEVYYTQNRSVYAVNLKTRKQREIGPLPENGAVSTLNSDETMLAGTITQGGRDRIRDSAQPQGAAPLGPDGKPLTFAEQREVMLNNRLERRLPMTLFTLDTRNGATKTFYGSTDWLNHLQFSPTQPDLLMFCHEGPWHKIDRIWTIRTDGTALTKIHARTMNMEIAGHEFFSADGQTIWYDLQTPRGQDFWVAGYNLKTQGRTHFHLERNEWSVHFNVSPDGTLFAGDGGDSEMVAHAPNGQWIYVFRPQTIPDVAGIKAPNAAELIKPGFFESEKLVDMSKHDYRLEPNVTFTPDQKWIVFRSNMLGPTHVFAVEIEKKPQTA